LIQPLFIEEVSADGVVGNRGEVVTR
jgi:hypothetical protein